MISPGDETALSGSESSSFCVAKSVVLSAGIGSATWRHFQYKFFCLSTRRWSLSFSSRICVSFLVKTSNKRVTSSFRSLQHPFELTAITSPNNSECFTMIAVWRLDNKEELSWPRRLARSSISDTLVLEGPSVAVSESSCESAVTSQEFNG